MSTEELFIGARLDMSTLINCENDWVNDWMNYITASAIVRMGDHLQVSRYETKRHWFNKASAIVRMMVE